MENSEHHYYDDGQRLKLLHAVSEENLVQKKNIFFYYADVHKYISISRV